MAKRNPKQTELSIVVTEVELVDIETRRAQLKLAAANLNAAKNQLEADELRVIERLKAGAIVDGRRTATVEQKMGPCSPRYKELYIKLMSEKGVPEPEAEQKAKDAYPPTAKDVLCIGPNWEKLK